MRDTIWDAAKAAGDRAAVRTLARWFNTFNVWEWPGDFPIPKPAGWDELPPRDKHAPADKFRTGQPYMDAIRSLIPQKEILRDWHTRQLRRTDDEFEAWWRDNFYEAPAAECDTPALVHAEPASPLTGHAGGSG